jgi:peptidoglycan/LPS O-acetylase OafA/YrhL
MPGLVTLALFLVIFAGIFLTTGYSVYLILLFLIGTAGARYYLGIDNLSTTVLISLAASALIGMSAGILVSIVAISAVVIVVLVKIPRLRILTFLGGISYSLYQIHVPIGGRIINLGRRFVDNSVLELGLSLFALAVTIGVAAIYAEYIEAPARWVSKKIRLDNKESLVDWQIALIETRVWSRPLADNAPKSLFEAKNESLAKRAISRWKWR